MGTPPPFPDHASGGVEGFRELPGQAETLIELSKRQKPGVAGDLGRRRHHHHRLGVEELE